MKASKMKRQIEKKWWEKRWSMRAKKKVCLYEIKGNGESCIHVRFFWCIRNWQVRTVPFSFVSFRRNVYRNKLHSILDFVCAIATATTMTSTKRRISGLYCCAPLTVDINRNFIRDFRQHFRALLMCLFNQRVDCKYLRRNVWFNGKHKLLLSLVFLIICSLACLFTFLRPKYQWYYWFCASKLDNQPQQLKRAAGECISLCNYETFSYDFEFNKILIVCLLKRVCIWLVLMNMRENHLRRRWTFWIVWLWRLYGISHELHLNCWINGKSFISFSSWPHFMSARPQLISTSHFWLVEMIS